MNNFLSKEQIENCLGAIDIRGSMIFGTDSVAGLEDIAYVILTNNRGKQTAYSANILLNEFEETKEGILKIASLAFKRSEIQTRILIHLQSFENGFLDSNGVFILLQNKSQFPSTFEQNECYLMEVDENLAIKNVISNTTTQSVINPPSWLPT